MTSEYTPSISSDDAKRARRLERRLARMREEGIYWEPPTSKIKGETKTDGRPGLEGAS